MRYISQQKFAVLCGISKQAVAKALKTGRLIRTKDGLDPTHPINKYFMEHLAQQLASESGARQRGRTEAVPLKPPPPDEEPEEKPLVTPQEKDYQITRLKKIQADKALLEYAQKANLLIDNDTLQRKIGKFMDFLLTSLIYLPEEVSDVMWSRANAADDPPREVRIFLEDKIGEIIKKAKTAAAELEPPKSYVKYVLVKTDEDGEE